MNGGASNQHANTLKNQRRTVKYRREFDRQPLVFHSNGPPVWKRFAAGKMPGCFGVSANWVGVKVMDTSRCENG